MLPTVTFTLFGNTRGLTSSIVDYCPQFIKKYKITILHGDFILLFFYHIFVKWNGLELLSILNMLFFRKKLQQNFNNIFIYFYFLIYCQFVTISFQSLFLWTFPIMTIFSSRQIGRLQLQQKYEIFTKSVQHLVQENHVDKEPSPKYRLELSVNKR